MTELRCVLPSGNLLGESPWWCVREQALYRVDSIACALMRFDSATGNERRWQPPEFVGSIALCAAGGAIVALGTGVTILDFETGRIGPVHRPKEAVAGTRFNDGKCDRRGRFWAGDHCPIEPRPPLGSLYAFGADLAGR